MAGVTAKHKKDGHITYSFRGDLKECIEKAKTELRQKELSQERDFLRWQHEKAKKALETYERRIEDLRGFIELGEKELVNRRAKEQEVRDGEKPDNHNQHE